MPSIDVETGAITPQGTTIDVGTQFTWTCSEASDGTKITVTANLVNGHPWFETSPTPQFTTPNASGTVTAQEAGDDCTWTAHGVVVDAGAHVKVVSTKPQRKAS
jgi:hypothetical protein